MMSKKSIVFFQIVLFSIQLCPTKSQTWIRAGFYWSTQQIFPVQQINSTLFTHLICGFADLNSTSYELSLITDDGISNFTEIVKQKNPSVTTILSIGGRYANDSDYSSMVSNSSYRKSFIDSSVTTARRYGFEGLDFYWLNPDVSDMSNLVILFEEWRAAISSEARNSSKSQLILTVTLDLPYSYSEWYPIDKVQQYVNWSHVLTNDVDSTPETTNFTAAPSALYNPTNDDSTDTTVRGWIDSVLPAKKLVMYLPYFGYAWKLVNSSVNGIGAPATGPAMSADGFQIYKDIKSLILHYSAKVTYNPTYVVNYFTVETSWISFDDIEAIRVKVDYVKKMSLLGYVVWRVTMDDNCVLSLAAAQQLHANISLAQPAANISPSQEDYKSERNKRPYRFLAIILPTTAAVMLVLGFAMYFRWMKKPKSRACVDTVEESTSQVNNAAVAGHFNGNASTLVLYSLADMEVATDNFSIENKLGEGGYGPVYKGVLQEQQIAIKKLSKTSTQGFEEFKNEVMLTAKLQHVNLVRLLGFCIDKEEHMLVYEYMSNRSLDYYLFDHTRKYILDWKKRIHIIEGICQGLLYLQEYSRLTIIHRDLKASNVLLDEEMKPKISDFGMARIFSRDGPELNTSRIIGTIGYAPPEYVERGIYSIKSDVYSFGVLLLQIISGKRVSILYGYQYRHLTLLEYAYELWKDGKGMEFVDSILNDTYSQLKLERCLHIALLCVQEIPIDRPSMLEVSWILRNNSADLMIPKKPGFSKNSNEDMKYDSTTSNMEIGSASDNTTISSLEAR